MATIKTSTGAQYARLLGVGAARGSRVVSNEEMCTWIDSTPEWIEQRTGITERRWVTADEDELSLSVDAARKAVDHAGLTMADIDAVICSTISAPRATPSLAVAVADVLGIDGPAAFDISAACAGFGYGCGQAESLVRSGVARNVLVIGVEVLSKVTDLSDRGTAFLFGDGAGAVVVGPSDVPAMGPLVWGSDGSQQHVIETDRYDEVVGSDHGVLLHMEGRPVFRWATTAIADKAKEALAAAGITPQDLEVFIPHQANNRITDSMLRHLDLPEDVVVARDIKHMGNTSAASVPIAMAALLESGAARSGQTALYIGFGAGLVYAGQVITLP